MFFFLRLPISSATAYAQTQIRLYREKKNKNKICGRRHFLKIWYEVTRSGVCGRPQRSKIHGRVVQLIFFSFGLGPLIFKFFVSFFPNRPGIMHEKKKKKHYHNSPIDFDQTFKILKLYDFLLTPDLIPSR